MLPEGVSTFPSAILSALGPAAMQGFHLLSHDCRHSFTGWIIEMPLSDRISVTYLTVQGASHPQGPQGLRMISEKNTKGRQGQSSSVRQKVCQQKKQPWKDLRSAMEDASRRMWTGGSATKACALRGNDWRPTLGRVGKLRDTGRGRAVRETRKKRSDQVDGSKGGRTRQLVMWTRTVQYREEHPSSSRVLREIWHPPPTHTLLGFSLSHARFQSFERANGADSHLDILVVQVRVAYSTDGRKKTKALWQELQRSKLKFRRKFLVPL